MKKILRPIRIDGEFAYIPLTKGFEAIIDSCDVKLVENRNWFARKCPHSIYAASQMTVGAGKQTAIHLHRLIAGVDDSYLVDHIDGNGLNNTRKNLRFASHSQNMQNRKTNKNASSGEKCVRFRKDSNKWCARIQKDGHRIYLGSFSSKDDAIVAYRNACELIHGDFARTE